MLINKILSQSAAKYQRQFQLFQNEYLLNTNQSIQTLEIEVSRPEIADHTTKNVAKKTFCIKSSKIKIYNSTQSPIKRNLVARKISQRDEVVNNSLADSSLPSGIDPAKMNKLLLSHLQIQSMTKECQPTTSSTLKQDELAMKQKVNLLRRAGGGRFSRFKQSNYSKPMMVDRMVASSMQNSVEQLSSQYEPFQNSTIKNKIDEVNYLEIQDGSKESKRQQSSMTQSPMARTDQTLKHIIAKEEHIKKSLRMNKQKRRSLENWKNLMEDTKKEQQQISEVMKGVPNSFISVNQLLRMNNHANNLSNSSVQNNTKDDLTAKEVQLENNEDEGNPLDTFYDLYCNSQTHRLSINSQFLEKSHCQSIGNTPNNNKFHVNIKNKQLKVDDSQLSVKTGQLLKKNGNQLPQIGTTKDKIKEIDYAFETIAQRKTQSKEQFQRELYQKINQLKNLVSVQNKKTTQSSFSNYPKSFFNTQMGYPSISNENKQQQQNTSYSPDNFQTQTNLSNYSNLKTTMDNLRQTAFQTFQEKYKAQEKQGTKLRRKLKVLERQFETNNELVSQKYKILNSNCSLAFKDAKLSKQIIFNKNNIENLKSFASNVQDDSDLEFVQRETQSLDNSLCYNHIGINSSQVFDKDSNPTSTSYNKFKSIELRQMIHSKFQIGSSDYIDRSSQLKLCRHETPSKKKRQNNFGQFDELRKIAGQSELQKTYHLSVLGRQPQNEKTNLMLKPIKKMVEQVIYKV